MGKPLEPSVQGSLAWEYSMHEVEPARPLRILVVEDSPSDVRLLKEAFKEASVSLRMTAVSDGVEAMAYLTRMVSGLEPRPDLMILDLNLPRKSGREVLAEIKNDERLRSLPVLVMTSSNSEDDVAVAYRFGADSFTTKPSGLAEYLPIVRAIENFWLLSERLPHGVISRLPHFEPYMPTADRLAS